MRWIPLLIDLLVLPCLAACELPASKEPAPPKAGLSEVAVERGRLRATLDCPSLDGLMVGHPVTLRMILENPGDEVATGDVHLLNARFLRIEPDEGEAYHTVDSLGHGPITLYPGMRLERQIDLSRHFGGFRPGRAAVRWETDRFLSNRLELHLTEDFSKLRAVIHTNLGEMTMRFYPEAAPRTVSRFVELARSGFYRGTTFHRIIKGFMIQGGDPTGTGSADVGFTLRAELSDLKHETGTVAMARRTDPYLADAAVRGLIEGGGEVRERREYLDSASCSFYICLAPQPSLDGFYTIFGRLVDGFDVLQRIGDVETSGSGPGVVRPDRPLEDVVVHDIEIIEARTLGQ